jgi:hypothetical protein
MTPGKLYKIFNIAREADFPSPPFSAKSIACIKLPTTIYYIDDKDLFTKSGTLDMSINILRMWSAPQEQIEPYSVVMYITSSTYDKVLYKGRVGFVSQNTRFEPIQFNSDK